MTDYKYQFDAVADIYDSVRPGPPTESVDVVKEYAKLNQDSRVLEVGVASGQATLGIANVGCEIVGLELGPNLTQIAQQKLAPYPKVSIYNTSFEDWKPQPASFDLFYCVQAFHWIDTAWGLDAISKNLKSNGTLAIMWHIDCSSTTDFYKATQPVYDRFNRLMALPDKDIPLTQRPTPNNWDKVQKALEEHNDFKDFKTHHLTWEHHLDKNGYLNLLQTFSNHNLLKGQDKIEFYDAISKIIDDFGGKVTRIRETITLLASKS